DVVAKFGAERLATGHYARVEHGGRHRLLRARDAAKDQSYALYMLGQRELSRLELPIGELADKSMTRAIAARFGLPTATKPDSMDICFIGGDYRSFVRERAPEAFDAGPVERADGTAIGRHAGIGTLTVGQRTGTGVATGERLYVLRLEPDRRAAIVGTRAEISATTYQLHDVRFTADRPPAARYRTDVLLRYRGAPLAGWVSVHAGTATLELDAPALVAPGQAAVFQTGDEVTGGGIVSRVPAA
ncbi:MAG: tRNA methyl transferase PRC-barrel domain-containing protein, partial [Chloroflexota bacterium]